VAAVADLPSQLLPCHYQSLSSLSGRLRGIPNSAEAFLNLDDRLSLLELALQTGILPLQLLET
jgi:hypothetical protein